MFKISFKKNATFAFMLPVIWFGSLSLILILVIAFLVITNSQSKSRPVARYSIFSSKPLVLGATTANLISQDSRAARIDKVLEYFGCPVTNLGSVFVKEADNYEIPYWLVPAIGFQESNCGKKAPLIDSATSNNWWGYGIWGKNIKQFESVEDGISAVSKYVGTNFFSQGITDPCEIMKVYTPSSSGSWCEGVKYFGDIITSYRTPLD